MWTDGGAVVAQRLSNRTSRHDLLIKLRRYGVCAVLCAVAMACIFAVQAFATPYPLPASLGLLAIIFLVAAVIMYAYLTQQRWCEIHDEGVMSGGPFGYPKLTSWSRMQDVRYFAGVAVPFSVKVAGRKSPLLLGVHDTALPDWTSECMRRMKLDTTRGGPLTTTRREAMFWAGGLALAFALFASPIGFLRAYNGAPGFAVWLLALGATGGPLAALLRAPLSWSPAGITVGRGRRTRGFAWHEVRGEWRRTITGAAGLYLHVPSGRPLRVKLSEWGAPRFVARLGVTPPAAPSRTEPSVSTGALFPVLLAVFTVVVGLQVHESARLFGQLGPSRVRAMAGVETLARLVEVNQADRGVRVRYAFEADGRTRRGQGWLLATAKETLEQRAFIPVRYAPSAPDVSIPVGEPTMYYALYYVLFAVFHGLFVLPLIGLWRITPAPAPFTVPGLPA